MQRKTRVQHCSSCKNHGMNSAKKNHKCDYQDCTCILCELLQRSQKVMRHQQRVWRHQKLKLQADNSKLEDPANLLDQAGKAKCQVCDKCRNHNKLVPKRNHKCKWAQCNCVYCNLTSKRRDLMKYLQRVRRSSVISEANPEVRKARKFLDDNESQFEFADDESGTTDEDDVREDARMEDDELEDNPGGGEQLITSKERVDVAEFSNQKILHPKKKCLLNFSESKSEPSFPVPDMPALELLESNHSARETLTDSQFTFKHYGEKLRLQSSNNSLQSIGSIDTQNQASGLRLPIAGDSSPPPLIQIPSRPSSVERESGPINMTNQSGKDVYKYQDHNSTRKRTLECSSPPGYPVHIEGTEEEELRMLPSLDLNQNSPPPRLALPISSTNMPLYIEPNETAMQDNLSPNHLQQLAALLMYQRNPMQLRNSDWSNQSVSPLVSNYQNITQPVIRPLPTPINAAHPYNPMHTFVNNGQWNQRYANIRPNFLHTTSTSSIPRPLTDSSQRCYMLNPF